jgi:hypothetical protein
MTHRSSRAFLAIGPHLRQPRAARAGGRWAPVWRAALAAGLVAGACGLANVAQAAPSATPMDEMRADIESGQFDKAYAVALKQPQLIGDPHFDFLYGLAAVNTGHAAEGVLALERHLAAVPANDRARLELARGYFLLGDDVHARAEFEFVLRYNPPAAVRRNIEGFLQAMQTREAGDNRATARFYAEAGLGHDSNVNGGTFRDELQLVVGTIDLVGSPSQQVPDSFGELAVGGQQLMRVTNKLSVFAGADLDQRSNFHQRAYDLTNGSLYAGLSQLAAGGLWRLTLGSNELRVGGDRYRDTLSSGVDGNFTLAAETALVVFLQYGELRYDANDQVRNGRSTSVGAMLTQNFPGVEGSPSVGVRASYSQEDNLQLRPDLSNKLPLLRVFASISPTERLRVALGLTAYTQKYGATDISFGSVRDDTIASVDLQVNYALNPRWSLRMDGSWTGDRSNQDLYDTTRRAASLKLRYQY